MRERRKVWKKKRPAAVTIVACGILVLFAVRLYEVFQPLLRMNLLEEGIHDPLTRGMSLTPVGSAVVASASFLLGALVGIVLLVGFLSLQRWAWVLLMAWTGLSLSLSLINYFYGRPNYIIMASDVIIALALSQSDVQHIFGIRTDPNEPAR